MFHIPHPLQADLPYLALVSDRLPVHGSPVAVCAVAASSPYYYFWDPAGFTADGSVEDFKRRRATEIKHGRIWAPVGLLQPTIGTTFSRRSLLPTDGACMISFWPYAWCLSRVDGNRLMHAMNGNSFCHVMLALMYVLLCIFTFEADTTLLLIDFAFCAVVHVMIALATVKKGRTCNRYLMPGRKVKGARYSCARRSKSGRKKLATCLLLLFGTWALQTQMCYTCGEFVHVETGVARSHFLHTMSMRSPFVSPTTGWSRFPWAISNKCRNRRQHSLNGNMVQGEVTRCKWESSNELPGVEIVNPDELKVPHDNMLQVIKASQVCDNPTGISFCNALLLRPKLRVRSEQHLALIVPGKMGQDLQGLLQEACPTLKAHAHECILTLRDPVLNRKFPRQVTIINLGKELVLPAELPHTVSEPQAHNSVLWIQAWKQKNVEMWNQIVSGNARETCSNVLQCISDILCVPPRTLDTWGFRLSEDSLHLCIRVATKDVDVMLNSKHLLLFARPFVNKGEVYHAPATEVFVWANDVRTTPELIILVNTLKGVKGFIGNKQGVGIRVFTEHVAAARCLLQSSSLRLTPVNRAVIGLKRFIVKGFPPAMGAKQVIDLMNAKPANQSTWTPWPVIPLKMIPFSGGCCWTLKADTDPSSDRLILDGGIKLVIDKIDTPHEIAIKKQKEDNRKLEAAKTKRREDYRTAQTSRQTTEDAWQQYRDNKAKGKTKTDRALPTPDSDTSKDIAAIKAQLGALTSRVDHQESRMDQLEGTLTQQHREVMAALQNLALGAPSAPSASVPTKRGPEVQSSPLKAAAGGTAAKGARKDLQALTM